MHEIDGQGHGDDADDATPPTQHCCAAARIAMMAAVVVAAVVAVVVAVVMGVVVAVVMGVVVADRHSLSNATPVVKEANDDADDPDRVRAKVRTCQQQQHK